jgi:hypothetical protein
MDSGRADVEYENWKGRKLDRKMLELLRRHAAKGVVHKVPVGRTTLPVGGVERPATDK